MATLRSGELARQAGVNVETLRFYERKGLLPMPSRQASGYRQYSPAAVHWLRFIKRAQELGFSLREIKELLVLREGTGSTCADVVALAERKIEDIDGKISDLRAMRASLTKLLKQCPRAAPLARCPIIEALIDRTHDRKSRRVMDKQEEEGDGR